MHKEVHLGRQPYLTDQLLTDVDNRVKKGHFLGLMASLLPKYDYGEFPLFDAISTVLLRKGSVVYLTQREVAVFETQARDVLNEEIMVSKREGARDMGISRRSFNNYSRRAIREIEKLAPSI